MLAAKNEYFISRFPGGVATVPVEVPDGGCGKSLNNSTSPLCAICDATDARYFGGRSLLTLPALSGEGS